MSGMEIVGLALGIIPLVLAAASSYRSALEPVRTVLQPRLRDFKLAEFYRDLLFEVTVLHEMLRSLFDQIPESSRHQRSDSVLNENDSHDFLAQKLGNTHAAFLEILESNMQAFNHIVSEEGLQLQGSTMTQHSVVYARLVALRQAKEQGHSMSELIGRIKFSAKEQRRQVLIRRLKENNERLERLFKFRTIDTALVGDSDSSIKHSEPPSEASRDVLRRLYDTIAQRWHCGSCSGHEAMMSLRSCCSWSSSKRTNLDIIMSSHSSPLRLWQESQLSIVETRTPRVAFADNEPKMNSAPRTSQPNRSHQRHPLSNICDSIHQAQQNHTHLLVEYDGNELWHVNPTTRIPPVVHAEDPRTTLETLLEQRTRIPVKLKRILAVTLAQGLLHFGESQWLNEEWNKGHVSFLCDAKERETDLSRPYLFTGFEPVLKGTDRLFLMHRNSSVLSLGILLLEIDLWKMIETHRNSEDLTDGVTVNANTDLTTAQRLVLEEGDYLYENYKKAINACLMCDFAPDAEPSLNNEAFRKGFYDRVLIPLETELYNGWKITVSENTIPGSA